MSRRVRFGVFEFDDAGVLMREGIRVRLQPQPARVLGILVARAGEVVSRDALREEIWNDGTFVDFERGLNFCIAQIRAALGDSAESPRFIETLPRRGYRFVAPVQPLTPVEQNAAPAVEARSTTIPERGPVTSSSARSRLPLAALLGLALVTVALVAGAWQAATIDRRIRIAVVPFDNETGTDDFDRIARGVADATVARLATPERVAALSVVGNAAVLQQPRGFRDLQRIGTELGADYVVLAQMKRDDAGVRLIAHLIRTVDQTHLWANTYDRPAFTLDIQTEVAESIAAAVVKTLASGPSHRS